MGPSRDEELTLQRKLPRLLLLELEVQQQEVLQMCSPHQPFCERQSSVAVSRIAEGRRELAHLQRLHGALSGLRECRESVHVAAESPSDRQTHPSHFICREAKEDQRCVPETALLRKLTFCFLHSTQAITLLDF